MGKKRGRAEGSFVRETGNQVLSFYGELVQNLKPWQAPAPKTHSAQPPGDGVSEEADGNAPSAPNGDLAQAAADGARPVPAAAVSNPLASARKNSGASAGSRQNWAKET